MTKKFYNDLAPYYKLLYQDWDASVVRQADALDRVIKVFVDTTSKTILDVACGIGTQSIGLARLGYQVCGSDLSPVAIEQAQKEALRYGVEVEFRVADMRQVWEFYQKLFDVVIACDNSVPHLLSDDEILLSFKQFYQCIKPGGGCIISVRDYAQIERNDSQKMYPRTVHQTEDGQLVMFDVWNFDGDQYEITTYIVEDKGGSDAKTKIIHGGKYYCVEIPTLERLFIEAGFRQVATLKDKFFQPLLVAIK
ncbi:MAG: methyltransferase family protein [Chloroflexi bacterium]|nr:MAG: methyltransferase family protein [Chloroflexota bacterium]